MQTTDKTFCRELIDLLARHGVTDAVLSPGSRNTPLIMAVARDPRISYQVVVDERSAAFIALGMSVQSGRPVALVCTSGTAMLNYAPAVAEAFYREVPLIVITADRPCEWIDQDDSQTIRQAGALGNIVRHSVDIPVETGSATQLWMMNRLVNDALIAAVRGPKGPVHINMQLDVPLSAVTDAGADARLVSVVTAPPLLPVAEARSLASELAPPCRVMVIAGFHSPDQKLSRAMQRLAAIPNVVVMHEAQANLHGEGMIGNIDRVLSSMTDEERCSLCPDVVITVGGSLVSRFVKAWLRGHPGLRHWHVGERNLSVDCFKCLEKRIELPASSFMPQLASGMQPFRSGGSDYSRRWKDVAARAEAHHREFISTQPWSDLTAMDAVVSLIPERWNLHVSNGTAVRYVQLSDYSHIHRIECNRGVSGIDGCTSTAIGAALAYKGGATLLVTGDMSAQYDMGALAANCIPRNFRMIVLNNGGGGIFRFIESTSRLEELEECFCADVRLPLRDLAAGFGFDYYEVRSLDELHAHFPRFAVDSGNPAIMNIVTPGQLSARILKDYFKKDR